MRQLQAYFDALSAFSLPLAWTEVEGFRKENLQMVAGIPYGELANYGGLAERAGKPGAARAVGSAVGSNPWLIVVPCHRVIGSDCRLHGFSALDGLEMKPGCFGMKDIRLSRESKPAKELMMEENQKRTFAQVLWRLSASPTLAEHASTALGSHRCVLLNRRPPAGANWAF